MKVSEMKEKIVEGMQRNSTEKITKKKCMELTNELMDFLQFDKNTPIDDGGLNYLSKKILKENGYEVIDDMDEKMKLWRERRDARKRKINDRLNR